MFTERRLVLLLLGLLGALAVFAACAGPSETVATPTAAGTALLPTPTPLGAEEKPIPGGWFRSSFGDPGYWSPWGGTSGGFTSYHGNYYSTLLTFYYGAGTDPRSFDFNLDESLVTKWETSKDGLTYTFHLRQGVKWQNKPPVNGRELVAEDVKWTYEQQIAHATAPRSAIVKDAIKSIECPDKYTVVIHLNAPRADFLLNLSSSFLPILAREATQVDPDLGVWQAQIGTGPFTLDEYTNNVRCVYKKNPTYFLADKGFPYLDGIYNVVIADTATGLAAFRAGQIDFRTVPRIELPSVMSTNPDTYCLEEVGYSGVSDRIAFRTDKAPLDDARVRQAISMAINRQEIIDALYEGYGVIQKGPVSVLAPWYLEHQGECDKYYEYNPAEARRLLTEAGYPAGLSLSLTCYSPGDNQDYLVDALSKIGIKLTLKAMDYGAFSARVYSMPKTYDEIAWVFGRGGGTFTADAYLNQFLMPGYGANYSCVDDPKMNSLGEAQTVEMDPVKREAILDEMQRYFACQQYYIHWPHAIRLNCMQPWVKNFYLHATGGVEYQVGKVRERMWLSADAPGRKLKL